MTDERWVFMQDIHEKKQVARSASKTNRKGKGPVKLPSDYMSKKELKKMNGEVTNYNLSQAVNWQNFKFWPKDIQQEYLDKINDTYHATFLDLERVFKTTVTTIRLYFKSRGLVYQSEKGRRTVKDDPQFQDFCEKKLVMTPDPKTEETPKVISLELKKGSFNEVTNKYRVMDILDVLCSDHDYAFTITFEEVNNEK